MKLWMLEEGEQSLTEVEGVDYFERCDGGVYVERGEESKVYEDCELGAGKYE